MKDIQCSNEEFVCVLLLITRQMSDVRPNQMKEFVKSQRGLVARIKLLEQMGYLADQTAIWLRAVMTVSKKIISQQWCVNQCLYNAIHEAGFSKIDQAS